MELVEGEEAVEDLLKEVLQHLLGCWIEVAKGFANVAVYFAADFVVHVV